MKATMEQEQMYAAQIKPQSDTISPKIRHFGGSDA